jgi:hypothetical protein
MGFFPTAFIITAIVIAVLFFLAVLGINITGNRQVQPIVVVVQQPTQSGWGATIAIVGIGSMLLTAFVLYGLLAA